MYSNSLTESNLFVFFAISLDFLFVMILGINSDPVYLILVFALGFLIPLHILKFRHFITSLWQARGLWLYDISYAMLFVYIYVIVPEIYERVVKTYGKSTFIFMYPVIELI